MEDFVDPSPFAAKLDWKYLWNLSVNLCADKQALWVLVIFPCDWKPKDSQNNNLAAGT